MTMFSLAYRAGPATALLAALSALLPMAASAAEPECKSLPPAEVPYQKALAKLEAEACALMVVRRAVAGSHTGHIKDLEAEFHFPHYRLASRQMEVLNSMGEQAPGRLLTMESGKWRYSILEKWDVVQSGLDKVHVAVRYSRYGDGDKLLNTYNSLWIITFENGRWGIKARSSFAP